MEITNAQHTQWNNEPCSIRATIDGEVCYLLLIKEITREDLGMGHHHPVKIYQLDHITT